MMTRERENAYTILRLTDGETTCDLAATQNYALRLGGWAPSVSSLSASTIGGRSQYNDVVEELRIDIFAQTGKETLANLERLSRLLDRAERWERGENVRPVIFECLLQGSALSAPLKAIVLGRADQSNSLLALPPTLNDQLMIYEISDVKLSFLRRGEWISSSEVTVFEGDEGNDLLTVNFSNAQSAILDIAVSGFRPQEKVDFDYLAPIGFDFHSDNNDELIGVTRDVIDPESQEILDYNLINKRRLYELERGTLLLSNQDAISILGAGAMAVRSNVFFLRDNGSHHGVLVTDVMIPDLLAVTGAEFSQGLLGGSRRIGVFATVASKSDADWRLRVVGRSFDGREVLAPWSNQTINNERLPVFIGSLESFGGISSIEFQLVLSASRISDPHFELINLIFVAMDNPATRTLTFDERITTYVESLDDSITIQVKSSPLAERNPISLATLGQTGLILSSLRPRGNAWLTTQSNGVTMTWLARQPYSEQKDNNKLKPIVTRYQTYLTPQ